MLLISYGYKALNSADPDCGTTFTWGARAFGPKTGWLGGWGIIAADILVMASLAQIAGQYVFLLFNANGIGHNAEQRVGAPGGDRVDRGHDRHLLRRDRDLGQLPEGPARDRAGHAHGPLGGRPLQGGRRHRARSGHLTPSWSWFNPFNVPGPESFMVGFTLMLFIYWGWDTAVSVNEETKDRDKTPGRAAVTSTFILLAIYAVVIIATQSYAGIGSKGIGLTNSEQHR